MEAAVGAASWLLDKVLNKLSEDLVAAYVSSSVLGLRFNEIKMKLQYTQGLLQAAQERDVKNNAGLQGLLLDLSKKADEAEDALDELHYFRIQDELDGTDDATPDLGDDLRSQAQHARHALRHNVGNWLSCFTCCRSQDDVHVTVVENNPHDAVATVKSASGSNDEQAEKLRFDRVAMSNKIKSVMEGMHSLCQPISRLLKLNPSSNPVGGLSSTMVEQPLTSSIIKQQKLYGREAIFNQTISDMTNVNIHPETLSVLPIFGIGGIGKTTFAQHLYNNEKTEEHFTVRAWVCVSTDFDVLKLTKEILGDITEDKNEGSYIAHESNSLDQLQKSIVKRLKSERFLIVLDDIWEHSQHKWDDLLAPLRTSEHEKGSMVLVTTRHYGIAEVIKTTYLIQLESLETSDIQRFFEDYVFDQVTVGSDMEHMTEIARQIANKLKGSPLAATTVGRLLRRNFSLEYWKGILDRHEWLDEKDGILPALKISYNYLPFHLKKCFQYFCLFPEDYKFHDLNITQLWIAIGVIGSSGQDIKPEITGLKYLEEFVDHGFLVKQEGGRPNPYYVMHDLLHELSRRVSSHECAHISSTISNGHIPQSIRHLSITIGELDTDLEEKMDELRTTVDIGSLRSLMLFGSTSENINNILEKTFREIKSIRVLSIMCTSKYWLPNFSRLIHLRYLRIGDQNRYNYKSPSQRISLPSTMCTLYHLKFLEIDPLYFRDTLLSNLSRLVSLRHFLAKKEFHSNIPEVGRMKCLQELEAFCVKKQSVGFELRELGNLKELGGKITVYNLEKVESKEEASEARLTDKKNLKKLSLVWDEKRLSVDADILDCLQPHSNLKGLHIANPPGDRIPSWLCNAICFENLESLHLKGVSWVTLPHFGLIPRLLKLHLENIAGWPQFKFGFSGGLSKKSSPPLKTIEFVGMPELVEWAVEEEIYLSFPNLESISCISCPVLSTLPILDCPKLQSLQVKGCPKLSLPPLPHTSTLTSIDVNGQLIYSDKTIIIHKYTGDLAFQHLGEVERMSISSAPELHGICMDTLFKRGQDESIETRFVEKFTLRNHVLTSKSLSMLTKCLPALSELSLDGLSLDSEEVVLKWPSSTSLQKLEISSCGNLILPVEDGGALRDLTSLRSLRIRSCGQIFSRWSIEEPTQTINPLLASLKELDIWDEPSMQSMGLLSNLTSLTRLHLQGCDKLKIDGFNPLIVCNNLKLLGVTSCGSVAADLLAEVARSETLPAGAFRLETLCVDCISAVLVAPICRLLSATLKELYFQVDKRTEGFTEEQEQALLLLHSLQELYFDSCEAVRSLPDGLHCLPSLKVLTILRCPKLRSLPERGLPASLWALLVINCSREFEREVELYKNDHGVA